MDKIVFKQQSNHCLAINHNQTKQQVIDSNKNAMPSMIELNKLTMVMFSELYHKIGATSELPVVFDKNHSGGIAKRKAFFVDLYFSMFLKNKFAPSEIPFDVVMDEFILYAVQNSDKRKGNNQAAIIEHFNTWIKKPETRHQLILERNKRYPQNVPKALNKRNSSKLKNCTKQELIQRIQNLKRLPFKSLKSVQSYIKELEDELFALSEAVKNELKI